MLLSLAYCLKSEKVVDPNFSGDMIGWSWIELSERGGNELMGRERSFLFYCSGAAGETGKGGFFFLLAVDQK